MLQITINEGEAWDNVQQEFKYCKKQTLQLEHSLVSISKWESKWQKPFLNDGKKTTEEMIDYIRCMTVTQNVDPFVYMMIDEESFHKINEYINSSATATTITDLHNKPVGRKEIITSEVIYYWMISYNIPMECQKWHLNRLLTLIKICNVKNAPPKKMSKREIASRNAEINAARRRKLGTSG